MRTVPEIAPNIRYQNNVVDFNDRDTRMLIETKRRRISVLVVDDDEIDYHIIQRNLSRMQAYEADIHYAQDLVTAREITAMHAIDLALVDYCLGVESGVSAITEIGGRCGRIPVIMVSGMPGTEVPQIALKAGAINHINKNELSPVMFDSLIRSAIYTHRIEAQLQSTIQELNRANQAKDNFFSRMSHDLKTPLNAILGYCEAMKAGVYGELESSAQSEAINNIQNAGHFLLETINNLIVQASSSEAVKGPEFQPLKVSEILANAINIVEQFAKSSGHEINADGLDCDIHVNGQKLNLTQAITNVLTNAIIYSDKPSEILVSLHEREEYVELRIQDHGIGMNEEDITKAFEHQGRVELPAHLAKEGTGFGLSIVQDVIKAHSGTLRYSSVPEQGTLVVINIPKLSYN